MTSYPAILNTEKIDVLRQGYQVGKTPGQKPSQPDDSDLIFAQLYAALLWSEPHYTHCSGGAD